MHCGITWVDTFVDTAFPKQFEKFFRDHREKLWLAEEKTYLPAAQAVVEANVKRKLQQDKLEQKIQELYIQQDEIDFQIQELRDQINHLKGGKFKPKIPTTRHCPINDCRGFLTEKWLCGLCGVKVCRKCHCVKRLEGEPKKEHTCDPNQVANAKEIEKSTHTCPKCATRIYRIAGCNQM